MALQALLGRGCMLEEALAKALLEVDIQVAGVIATALMRVKATEEILEAAIHKMRNTL